MLMVHRGIATLSGAMMFCFLSLAQLDTQFFFLHFYESLIYLAIILMLFYFEDHWAYMLGMLAPSFWLVFVVANGLLFGALRQVWRYLAGSGASGSMAPTGIALVTLLSALLAILMIIFCAQRWKREYAGMGKGWSTFLGSLAVVMVYYGVLLYWFGRLFPWE